MQAQERLCTGYWSGFYLPPDANWPAPSGLLNLPERERAMGPPNHGEAGAGSDLLLLMPCVLLPNNVPQYTRGHRDRCCRKFNSKPPIFSS